MGLDWIASGRGGMRTDEWVKSVDRRCLDGLCGRFMVAGLGWVRAGCGGSTVAGLS